MIDLPARKLIGKIKTPHPLAGITISADGRTIIAVDDAEPNLFLIDAASENIRTVPLQGFPKAAQIARYRDDFSLLAVSAVSCGMVSLIDPSFTQQTAIQVGSQPMDMAFRGDELFVGCQGDGTVHVIDIPSRKWKSELPRRNGLRIARIFLV